jgi:hypothetical protein
VTGPAHIGRKAPFGRPDGTTQQAGVSAESASRPAYGSAGLLQEPFEEKPWPLSLIGTILGDAAMVAISRIAVGLRITFISTAGTGRGGEGSVWHNCEQAETEIPDAFESDWAAVSGFFNRLPGFMSLGDFTIPRPLSADRRGSSPGRLGPAPPRSRLAG